VHASRQALGFRWERYRRQWESKVEWAETKKSIESADGSISMGFAARRDSILFGRERPRPQRPEPRRALLAVPDEGVPFVRLDQAAEDRRREAGIVQLDREVGIALLARRRPRGSDFC